jgi:hypothetical protein
MRRLSNALKISSLAALAGWCAGTLYCWCAIFASISLRFDFGFFAISVWVGVGMAAVILCVWILVLLPLALIVPSRSFFWKTSFLAPFGLLTGLIIAAVGLVWLALRLRNDWPAGMYDWHINSMHNLGWFGPPSAIVALTTGVTAAFFHRRECSHPDPV